MKWVYIFLAIFSVMMASTAQMLLKKSATQKHSNLVREYLNVWVIVGYSIMGLSLLTNIFAMSRGLDLKEMSVIESLSYLFVPLLSAWFFNETISVKKTMAILIIIFGIILFFI